LTTYTWNADNRLASISTNGRQFGYEYDRAGMRTAQIVDGVRTNYLLDVNRSNPVVAAEYSQPAISTAIYNHGASLISRKQENNESFYLSDGHSGIRLLTDSLGSSTSTSSYDAYGNTNSTGSNNTYLYREEQFDSQTRLQYLRARYYDPNTGRFLGVDPLEGNFTDPTSRHRYLYGNANPVSYSDPSGKFSILDVALAGINYLERDRALEWNGRSFNAGLSGEFLGLPGVVSATANIINLRSNWHNNTAVDGTWLLLGVGLSLSVPVSLSASPSVKVTTPSIFGNSAAVLSGLFTSASVNISPGLGQSYTAYFFMGLGYGLFSGSFMFKDNFAVGADLGFGQSTGLSIPLRSTRYRR
jgi:RHS repeat-associated protein